MIYRICGGITFILVGVLGMGTDVGISGHVGTNNLIMNLLWIITGVALLAGL